MCGVGLQGAAKAGDGPNAKGTLLGCRLQKIKGGGEKLTQDLVYMYLQERELTLFDGGEICPPVPVHDTRNPRRSHRSVLVASIYLPPFYVVKAERSWRLRDGPTRRRYGGRG